MYRGLVANISVVRCCGLMRYVNDLKALVLSQSWLVRASNQAVVTNNLVLYSHYPRCIKLSTRVRNQPTSQPIAIVVATDWATKRNTLAVSDQYVQQISYHVDTVGNT